MLAERIRWLLNKNLRGLPYQRQLGRVDRRVINWAVRRGQFSYFSRADPAVLRQQLQADQQRISGKCGDRGIRRVAQASRAQGQVLPQALLGGVQEIDEGVGRGTER